MYGTTYLFRTTAELQALEQAFAQAAKTGKSIDLENLQSLSAQGKTQSWTLALPSEQCQKMLPILRRYLQELAAGTAKRCEEGQYSDYSPN